MATGSGCFPSIRTTIRLTEVSQAQPHHALDKRVKTTMQNELQRPDPERLLQQVMAQERQTERERLKVFLGYASGVGKSLRMLDEARRRRERGQDVVIAAIQKDRGPLIDALLCSIDQIPMKMID